MEWDWILFSVAITGLIIGWCLGYWQRKIKSKKTSRQDFTSSYFKGINYLLSEKPDQAVDVFIKNIEVNLETIETHLSLGILFRKRGENDRSIKIHQNLLAQPGLSRVQLENVQLELAKDYLSAGLLDRAERLLLELIDQGGRNRKKALEKLVLIYEQLKDWNLALSYGEMLLKADGHSILTPLAHYCCECADISIETGNYTEALQYTKRALQYDRRCVRASILQANIETKTEQYKSALKAIQRINQQDQAWISEVLDLIVEIYNKSEQPDSLTDYLLNIMSHKPQVKLALEVAKQLEKNGNPDAAVTYLTNHVESNPTWLGLAVFFDYFQEIPETSRAAIPSVVMSTLNNLIGKWLEIRASFSCSHCGFKAQSNHWQCPSCKKWGTVAPIEDSSSFELN